MAKTVKKQEIATIAKELVVVTKTDRSKSVRLVLQDMGDSLKTNFDKTADLKTAQAAISAYATAINIVKTQVMYKRLTGTPGKIDFFE
jgi:hypothetical protein